MGAAPITAIEREGEPLLERAAAGQLPAGQGGDSFSARRACGPLRSRPLTSARDAQPQLSAAPPRAPRPLLRGARRRRGDRPPPLHRALREARAGRREARRGRPGPRTASGCEATSSSPGTASLAAAPGPRRASRSGTATAPLRSRPRAVPRARGSGRSRRSGPTRRGAPRGRPGGRSATGVRHAPPPTPHRRAVRGRAARAGRPVDSPSRAAALSSVHPPRSSTR